MDSSATTFTVNPNEASTMVYRATLQDESVPPVAIGSGDIDTLTLTLVNEADGSIINGRSDQNVLNANNVTVSAGGDLVFIQQPADTAIINPNLSTETHLATFKMQFNTTSYSNWPVKFSVINLSQVGTAATSLLDATVSGASANSYATVAQANTYHLGNLNRATWLTALNTQKEPALIMATRLLNEQIRWDGTKTTSAQRLPHPRTNLYNADGEAITTTVIAPEVIDATCELAWWLLESNRVADTDNAGLSELKVGPIELVFKDESRTTAIPEVVLQMLQPYGDPLFGGVVVPLVRT
jgi:hypothetical protein